MTTMKEPLTRSNVEKLARDRLEVLVLSPKYDYGKNNTAVRQRLSEEIGAPVGLRPFKRALSKAVQAARTNGEIHDSWVKYRP